MQNPVKRQQNIILILGVFAVSTAGVYGKYSSGTGGQKDPYQIATFEDLLELAADINNYDATFILTADIDIAPDLPGRKVFSKAVIAGGEFAGVLDGAGHNIKNLTIDTNGDRGDHLGLFATIGDGTIKNLGLENVKIKSGVGSRFIGGLAGENGGTITNCLTTGTICSGNDSDCIGGLAGDNCRGTILNSLSTCSIAGGANSSNLGGLVGGNMGTISECYSAGKVTGGMVSMWLGGLAGSNCGIISNCYSMSAVTGGKYSYNLGDLVGDSSNGTVVNCYSTIKIKATGFNIYFFTVSDKKIYLSDRATTFCRRQ